MYPSSYTKNPVSYLQMNDSVEKVQIAYEVEIIFKYVFTDKLFE